MNPAPYATAEIALGRLTLTPGLRFDPLLIEGSPVAAAGAPATAPRGYARFDVPQNPVGPIGDSDAAGATRKVLRWMPNPRLIATFRATKRLAFTAGGGIYGQPPDPEDMSPVFGNPTITRVARDARVGRRQLQAAADADARDRRLLQAPVGSGVAQRASDAAAGRSR